MSHLEYFSKRFVIQARSIDIVLFTKYLILLLFFSTVLSIWLFNFCSLLILISFFYRLITNSKEIRRGISAVNSSIFLFIVFAFVSIFWSQGGAADIVYAAKINWKLLLVPILSYYVCDLVWIRRCIIAFSMGCFVLLVLVLLTHYNVMAINGWRPDSIFFNQIPQSVGFALFSCILLYVVTSVNNLPLRVVSAVLFLCASIAVLSVSGQRIGYLSWFVGCGLVLYFSTNRKLRIFYLLSLIIFSLIIFTINDRLSARISQAYKEYQGYMTVNNKYTSIGSRVHMWSNGLSIIRESSMMGNGMGSYPVISKRKFDDDAMCEIGCGHPHNMFIFYGIEYGFVGLSIFICFVVFLFVKTLNQLVYKALALPMIGIFLVVCLLDSPLWYRGLLNLFVPILGLVLCFTSLRSVNAIKIMSKS